MANRVEKITAVGGVWLWVPTNGSPVDLPTRCMTVVQLSSSNIWLNGPEWLKPLEAEWLKHRKNDADTSLLMMAPAHNEVPKYVEDIVNTPKTSKKKRYSLDTALAQFY